MKILRIVFGGHHKIGLYLGVISMHFRVFSEGHCTEWRYLLGGGGGGGFAEISNIFWGA